MPKSHTSQHTKPQDLKRPSRDDHPPPEDELGGGDICSLEEAPPTEDDKPLE